MLRHHPYRIERQPAPPHLRHLTARGGVERQPHCSVLVGRVAGRHGVHLEQLLVALLGESDPASQIGQKTLERPAVAVAQQAGAGREVARV